MNAGSVELGDTRAEDVQITPNISLGRIVHYTLTEQDAAEISRRRTTSAQILARIETGDWPLGSQAHIGNEPKAGDVCPAIAVRVWGQKCANLQVFLDGNDVFWKTSASEDPNPGAGNSGFWHWPERS